MQRHFKNTVDISLALLILDQLAKIPYTLQIIQNKSNNLIKIPEIQ